MAVAAAERATEVFAEPDASAKAEADAARTDGGTAMLFGVAAGEAADTNPESPGREADARSEADAIANALFVFVPVSAPRAATLIVCTWKEEVVLLVELEHLEHS